MNTIRRFIRLVDNLNDWVGRIFSLLVVGMMLVLVWEIVLRYVFDAPTKWAHETSQFFFGGFFLLGGGYLLRWRGHVNVEIIYRRFSLRRRAILDLLTWALFFLFCGVLVWKTAGSAWVSVQRMEYSISTWGPPVWPIKLVIPIAAFLMLIQGLAIYIGNIYTAITGREFSTTVARKEAK